MHPCVLELRPACRLGMSCLCLFLSTVGRTSSARRHSPPIARAPLKQQCGPCLPVSASAEFTDSLLNCLGLLPERVPWQPEPYNGSAFAVRQHAWPSISILTPLESWPTAVMPFAKAIYVSIAYRTGPIGSRPQRSLALAQLAAQAPRLDGL